MMSPADGPFLAAGGSPAEYRAGVEHAINHGFLLKRAVRIRQSYSAVCLRPCSRCMKCRCGLRAFRGWTGQLSTANFGQLLTKCGGLLTGFNYYSDRECGWCVNYGGRSSRVNRARLPIPARSIRARNP
jgi:hypothetical protein